MTTVDERDRAGRRHRRAGSTRSGRLLRNSWRQLTSMRTALVLLFLLAVAAIPGSVLPQRNVSIENVQRLLPGAPGRWRRGWTGSAASTSTPRPGSPRSTCCCSPRWSAAWCPRLRDHVRRAASVPPTAPARLDRLPQHAAPARRRPGGAAAAIAAALRKRRWRVAVARATARYGRAEKGYLKETGNLLFHFALLAVLVGVGARLLVRLARQPAAGRRRGPGFCNTPAAVRRVGARPAGRRRRPAAVLRDAGRVRRRRSATPASRSQFRATVDRRRATGRPGSATFAVNDPLRLTAPTSTCSATGTRRSCATPTGSAQRRPTIVPFLPVDGMLTSRACATFPDANIDPKTGKRDPNAAGRLRRASTCRRRRDQTPCVGLGVPGRARPGAVADRLPRQPRAGRRPPAVGLLAGPAPDRQRPAQAGRRGRKC